MSVVRQSKFRHVFGTAFKEEFTYKDCRVASSVDSNCIEANSKFFAISWKAGGGGSLAVIKHSTTGKQPVDTPVLTGHTGQILDFRFNPFNDYLVATASEDCTIKIWGIPEEGLTANVQDALVTLPAHGKKVGILEFHNTASNILVSSGFDFKTKVWDIENGSEKYCIQDPYKDVVTSISFNNDGSLFATASKDKMLRVVDPRQSSIAAEGAAHQGVKGFRSTWMKNKDKIFTVGFTKMSERQFMLWDPRNLASPYHTADIDMSAGMLMPFYDEDTSILYLAGKGDANIRYFEMVDKDPYAYIISNYTSTVAQMGMAMLPKTACDVSSCEIARLYKLETNGVIPITFTVPRKEGASTFQEDLYPDTLSSEPALTADEWFGGKNAAAKTVSMRPGANSASSAPKMSDFKPKVVNQPKVDLPVKSNDPKVLLKQNDELRERVEKLERENAELRQKLSDLGH